MPLSSRHRRTGTGPGTGTPRTGTPRTDPDPAARFGAKHHRNLAAVVLIVVTVGAPWLIGAIGFDAYLLAWAAPFFWFVIARMCE
jgi:hypothetical protein